jgi:CPA1 family monovalent cation:H+ antiporter
MDHPTVGLGWVATALLMVFVMLMKRMGYTPVSGYGMAMGAFVCFTVNTLAGEAENPLKFEPEQFMYVLLPPIVLHSGLKFNWADAKETLPTSLVFAWLGTLGTAVWVAFGVWTVAGVNGGIVAFWIGSIVSPTDPVGTLDQMKALGDNPIRLVLEHESLLNDAVAVMLVHTSERAWKMSTTMTQTETMEIVSVALGMTVLSIAFGTVAAFLIRNVIDPQLSIVVGMFLFSLCESIQASGIIALFVFGGAIRIFTREDEHIKILEISKYVADLSETYVYVTIGGVVTQIDFSYMYVGLHAALACMVGRTINTFIFGYTMRVTSIRWRHDELTLMSACGMRGAVSLALAVSAPDELKPMMLTATVIVVVLSMISTSVATFFLIPLMPND